MRAGRRRSWRNSAVAATGSALAAAAGAPGGDGALIADSAAEFSSVQGGDNWHYGYYTSPGDAGTFTELCCFDAAGASGPWWERAAEQPPWNLVWAGGQQPGEDCTARRWISEVTGAVQADVTTGHWPTATAATTVQLVAAGQVVYERVLPAGPATELTEVVVAPLEIGEPLDLLVIAGGDPAEAAAVARVEIRRVVTLPPTVTAPPVIEVQADPGLCASSFVPGEPAANGSCQGGEIFIEGARADGLALDDPYPLGITRLDWTVEETGCPNDPAQLAQWLLVRAAGCPDCNGNGEPDECAVENTASGQRYLTIQGALDEAADGDEIVVGPGAYHETIDLLGKAVTLRGAAGAAATVLDVQGMAATIARCADGAGPDTVIEGLTFTGSRQVGDGGGLAVLGASPTVTGCRFIDNEVGGDGAGILSVGGGFPTVTDCSFLGNTAGDHGAGIYSASGSLSVADCVLNGNAALRGAGVFQSSGLELHVVNCVLSGNDSAEGTGMWIGLFDFDAVVRVANCTFAGNTGPLGSGIWMASACEVDVQVANCILWDQVVFEPCATNCYEYNNGDFDCGAKNIDADPLFVDPAGADGMAGTADDDLRLAAGSPCIDAGDNTALPEGVTADLDGNARFADDPGTPDTGNGEPPIVDMGALEFQPPCPWDCAEPGDGVVGITDFLLLLQQWGGTGVSCDLDLGARGAGIDEFLDMLANWGPCP